MLWASLPFGFWKPSPAQGSPDAETMLPLGYKVPVELLAHAEHMTTAKQQVERRYRRFWRKLPVVGGHMLLSCNPSGALTSSLSLQHSHQHE